MGDEQFDGKLVRRPRYDLPCKLQLVEQEVAHNIGKFRRWLDKVVVTALDETQILIDEFISTRKQIELT